MSIGPCASRDVIITLFGHYVVSSKPGALPGFLVHNRDPQTSVWRRTFRRKSNTMAQLRKTTVNRKIAATEAVVYLVKSASTSYIFIQASFHTKARVKMGVGS